MRTRTNRKVGNPTAAVILPTYMAGLFISEQQIEFLKRYHFLEYLNKNPKVMQSRVNEQQKSRRRTKFYMEIDV
jgi:hypothetical protein